MKVHLAGVMLASAAILCLRPALAQSTKEDEAAQQQRSRIDAYIARVAGEDTFEELAAGLSDHEKPFLGAMPVDFSPAGHMELYDNKFETCLANRRVARLYAILKEHDDADALCRKLFDEKLTLLQSRFESQLEMLDEQGGPQLRPIEELDLRDLQAPPMYLEQIALSGALFLSAEFCPVAEVLRQLDAWRAMFEKCRREFDLRSSDWDRRAIAWVFIEPMIQPQERFQMSLLASMLDRRFHVWPGGTWYDDEEAMQSLMARARQQTAAPRPASSGPIPDWLLFHRLPLCAWDAHANAFDYRHSVIDAPIDESNSLGNFTVFRGTTGFGGPGSLDQVFSDLRKRLLEAAAAAGETR